MLPIAEAEAIADPAIAPISIEETIFINAKPPGRAPIILLAKSISLLAIPPYVIIFPDKMKNGIAIREKLSKLVAICCAIVVRLGKKGIEKIIVKVEDIAIPQAMGVPKNVKTKKLIIKIKTGNISIYIILNYYTFHKKLLVYRLRV